MPDTSFLFRYFPAAGFGLFFLFLLACGPKSPEATPTLPAPELSREEASRLIALPLHCAEVVYPNKLNQVLADSSYLLPPDVLHPAFYGCFDWHSSVHGHWMMVELLKRFPDLPEAAEVRALLKRRLRAEHIAAEVAYFHMPENGSFERTYGWAWLLKLAEALQTWEDPLGVELSTHLAPLTQLIVDKYRTFLPKLVYPVRSGEHPNTAFGLSLAYDYALSAGETALAYEIEKHAKRFFYTDQDCPLAYEPSGYDFLSPCFQTLDLMRKVLNPEEFKRWSKSFLPPLYSPDFTLEVAQVSDRADGKLVHLDGLNFSRAWCLYGLVGAQPDALAHLLPIADAHVRHALPELVDENYEGTHWLGSFALYALLSRP